MIRSHLLSDPLETYLFSYRHDGAEWSLEIKARDEADARARLDRIQHARFDGKLVATVPAATGAIARVYVFIRNFLAQRS